jgi:WS/DGAT/MGAT family acyltransferase
LQQAASDLADPLDVGEHTGVVRLHDDIAGSPLLPGPAGRVIAAARRATSAAVDLSAALGAALADPRKAAELAGSARADAVMLRKLGFGLTADRNLLQGPLVPGKRRTWTQPVPVEAVKAAGAATGSTVNDLMLTAITSALRRYLLEHDALASEVIVIVPVNLRPASASLPAGLGNEFGLVFVRLPTGEIDQGRRRARVKAQMDQIKGSREGIFVYTMLQRMGQLPAVVQNAWVDAFAGRATAIVTNVSGPRHQIQIAGTPVAGMAGWVPVTGPLGLGLSIFSYAGQLTVGLAGDARLLPDHDRLLALLDEEVGALHTPTASSSPS